MSTLILVPTPIGNLQDITLRAIETLKQCDYLLAEDTRNTIFLLKHLGIEKKVYAYHAHNEHKQMEAIIAHIKMASMVALVSDAGTPGISDPGFLLVRTCIENQIKIETLPGATALIPALVNSGLPCHRFCFEGFLPQKKGRQSRLQELTAETRTMVFYESPYRLVKCLQQFAEVFGAERMCSVSRELTKMFEENYRGTLQQALAHFEGKAIKGEIVIVVAGFDEG
ncbi:MAG: 16S rRNA (cytidine(1402)-2'-O)-methyltransferase [Bacteroidia bacterium]|nr:16S rRNA (cytidine(1402)-2'-O)-methyltransferase [Bacteroidia bacterium]HQV00007.1 16S rRNA (cytidine(1402)-2'-O)-methyltransferase [Bacteroidia bacterium]